MQPVATGLNLWLEANVGVTTDSSGAVSSWLDQSGSGHNASQSTSAFQPLLVANALNGNPVVRFNGVNDLLDLSGQVLTSQQFTIIAVVDDTQRRRGHEQPGGILQLEHVQPGYFRVHGNHESEPGSRKVHRSDGGAADPSHNGQGFGNIVDPSTDFIFSGVSGASDASIYQDNSLIADKGSAPSQVNFATPCFIGSQGDGSAVSESGRATLPSYWSTIGP